MRGLRSLSFFLAAAIFLFQSGDCTSLFFAHPQAHDCCQKGHCSPKNTDPYCQLSSKMTVTQDQAKEKAAPLVLAARQVLPAWTAPVTLVPVDPESRRNLMLGGSGDLARISLPLLV
jgi:hypothetical protein